MAKKSFIAFCTPTLGLVFIGWASALRNIKTPVNVGSVELFCRDDAGNQIAEGRNLTVVRAMQFATDTREITHLFWLDDDVIVNSPDAILALYRHHRDIVSGTYFTKGTLSEPLIYPHRFGGCAPFVPDQLVDCWGHGLGLCLVKLDVYRRLSERGLPTDKYGNPQWHATTQAGEGTVDDPDVEFGGSSEDLHFLELCHQAGIKTAVDTSAVAFGWHLDVRSKRTYPEPQFRQMSNGEPIIWDTPEGPREWK